MEDVSGPGQSRATSGRGLEAGTHGVVRSRIVLHAPGFEPLTAGQHRDRFAATLARTTALWSLAGACGPLTQEGPTPVVKAWASGPDWRTDTELRLLAWDELIRAELAQPRLVRLGRGTVALADFLTTGTVARYARAHWRYSLFALYPMALLAGIAGLAAGTGVAIGGAEGVLTSLGLGWGLSAVAGRRLLLDIMLADWRFACDVARGRQDAYHMLIGAFAHEISAAMHRPDVDEVLLVGHSLGAVFANEALAQALRVEPALLSRPGAPRFSLLGLGPSTLKVALHPGATRLRAALALLAATPDLVWLEFASRRDVISFERSEAVTTLGLAGRGAQLESVHPRDMVDERTWRRIVARPARVHRQYVMGNGRRYFFDYGLTVCGPLPAGRGCWPDRIIGADGSLTTAGPVAPP